MDISRAFQDPHFLHAAFVHFPVALGVLGFPLVGAAAVTKMRPTLRQIVLAVYLLLALAAFAATTTGSAIQTKPTLPIVVQSLETHAQIARYIWMGAMATAVLVLLTAIRSEWFRAMFSMMAVLSAAVTTALIVTTAFYGQSLVYEHGLGTKPRPPVQVVAPPRPAPAPKPPAPPAAVVEPAVPPKNQELEAVQLLPPVAEVSSGQPKSVETLNNETLGALKNRRILRFPIEKPTQTYTERAKAQFSRAKRWVYKYMWPF
ncbi:MAG TPA: DUF2231 domain-containing protein [Candidatus Bathyarchaeia archaeon]|nr:DUF2231 domain-containing protein [Candidatus Bathyarchaeia archaeon]